MKNDDARVSDALDSYLQLQAGDRAEWLAKLELSDATLAREVLSLAEYATDQEFLHTPAGPIKLDIEHDDAEALVGAQVGDYMLLAQLGEGGFGLVFRAKRLSDGDTSAVIKLLRESMLTSVSRKRFARERAILQKLNHPGVAQLRGAGVLQAGTPYLVIEYVPGLPIAKYANEKGLTQRERIELFAFALDALAYAHNLGIVHRDLKPANMLAFATPTGHAVKLIDFGLARLTHASSQGTTTAFVTAASQQFGTQAYMSPEQLEGDPEHAGPKSDLYSAGVVLCELLTGSLPYGDAQGGQALRQAIDREWPIFAGQSLPKPLRWILERALRKEPNERFQSAQEFATELRAFASGLPTRTKQASAAYRTKRFVKEHRSIVATTAAAMVLLATAAGLSTRWALQSQRERANAETQRTIANEQTAVAQAESAALGTLAASQALSNADLSQAVDLLNDIPVVRRNAAWGVLRTLASPSKKIARSDNFNIVSQLLPYQDEMLAVPYSGVLTAFDEEGKLRWESQVPAEAGNLHSVCIVDVDGTSTIFALTTSGIYRTPLRTPHVWSLVCYVPGSNSPLVASADGKELYTYGWGYFLRARVDGSAVDIKRFPDRSRGFMGLLPNGMLHVYSTSGNRFAFDPATGEILWEQKSPEDNVTSYVNIPLPDGRVVHVTGSIEGRMQAVDETTGEVLASIAPPSELHMHLAWDNTS